MGIANVEHARPIMPVREALTISEIPQRSTGGPVFRMARPARKMERCQTNEEPMKAIQICTPKLFAMALLILACVSGAPGDEIPPAQNVKTFDGKIASVNDKERVIAVKGLVFTRTFNGADNCKVTFELNPQGSWSDLHPGQRVRIRYEDVQGVLIARQIGQYNLVFKGYVTAIDPSKHTMTVKHGAYNRNFVLAYDCSIIIKDNKTGPLDHLKVGHTVNVIYEEESGSPMTRRIEQLTPTFVGTISAIDAGTKVVKARDFLDEKKFNLADDCKIVIGGKPDGDLSALRIGESVSFSYEDVNGVLVAGRIAQEATSGEMRKASDPKVSRK